MKIALTIKTIFIISLTLSLIFACSKQEDTSPTPTSKPIESAPSPSNEASSSAKTKTMEATKSQSQAEPMTSAEPTSKSDGSAMQTKSEVQTPENQDKLALARKSGCLTCHSVAKKIVGPAWRDVSKRYKDVPDAKNRLIAKVSKGGSGNWKDVVGAAVMPPYSPRVSDENITQLVEFILALE